MSVEGITEVEMFPMEIVFLIQFVIFIQMFNLHSKHMNHFHQTHFIQGLVEGLQLFSNSFSVFSNFVCLARKITICSQHAVFSVL